MEPIQISFYRSPRGRFRNGSHQRDRRLPEPALAFEFPDKDSVLFFKPDDFKIMGTGEEVDPAKIDKKAIESAPDRHPEATIPDRFWVDTWKEHRLDGGGFVKPEPQGDWVVWGSVITSEMLSRSGR